MNLILDTGEQGLEERVLESSGAIESIYVPSLLQLAQLFAFDRTLEMRLEVKDGHEAIQNLFKLCHATLHG